MQILLKTYLNVSDCHALSANKTAFVFYQCCWLTFGVSVSDCSTTAIWNFNTKPDSPSNSLTLWNEHDCPFNTSQLILFHSCVQLHVNPAGPHSRGQHPQHTHQVSVLIMSGCLDTNASAVTATSISALSSTPPHKMYRYCVSLHKERHWAQFFLLTLISVCHVLL
jgi:hypothetical protein